MGPKLKLGKNFSYGKSVSLGIGINFMVGDYLANIALVRS